MEKIDITSLRESQATLLMPLWARAEESRRDRSILRDEKAMEIVDAIDYDFESFARKSVPQSDYCIRVSVFDQLVNEFLAANPESTIVELGVGLDSRFERLGHRHARWIEFDFPAVIELRKRFFSPNDRRMMVSGSLLDSDWYQRIAGDLNGPTLFVAEGVFYFLKPAEVQNLVRRMVDEVTGGQLLFDAQSRLFLRYNNLRHPLDDSHLSFAMGSLRQIGDWDPQLHIDKFVGFGDLPYYKGLMSRVGWSARWARRLFPPCRNLFKIVQVSWQKQNLGVGGVF